MSNTIEFDVFSLEKPEQRETRSMRVCRPVFNKMMACATSHLRCYTNWMRSEMPKLKPPNNGIVVRMYRIGHGDCFLLAMPREGGGNPVYVLIDCGYKP